MQSIKIFIIQLENSQRSMGLVSKLKELNLDFEVIDAENGWNFSNIQVKDKVDSRACMARLGYEISPGLFGCYLSHQKTYKKIVDEKFPWALVLEEDVQIIDFNLKIINQVIERNSEIPTIIQLFSRSSRLIKKSTINNFVGSQHYVNFEFHRRIIGSGAAAYLINQKAAKLALQNKIVRGAPDWPPWSTKVKFLGVFPWMFYEDSNGSTISNNEINRNAYRLRRVQVLLGLHYFIYNESYDSIKAYFLEEIYPYFLYMLWKAKGSKSYSNDINSPQIL